MKKFKTLLMILFGTSLIFGSCSKDDTLDIDDGTVVLPCDNSPQNLLTLKTNFDNSLNAIITYNSYGINNLDPSLPTNHGDFTTNTNLTYQLPTSTSFYNVANNLHGIIINRAGKYFTYNTNTNIGQEFTIANNISAPIELNNTTYIIEISNWGTQNQGLGNHYEIKSFDVNTGNVGATLPLDPATTEFFNNSFFDEQSMSASTNGIDELYFLSGTNLVTVNILTQTASHIDLHPNFTSDFVRFFGLEYSESLGLIAMKEDNTSLKLINIDTSTANYSPLLDILTDINSEFYSTAYRECDQTYFVTTLKNGNNPETIYHEFNLTTNTIENTQIFADYVFGIELMP